MKVRDLMTADVITIDRDFDLATAERWMAEHRIRHLPVVDEDRRVVGLITHRDLLRAELSHLHGIAEANARLKATVTVQRVMVADPECAHPDAPLHEAADTMRHEKYGCLPVVEGGRLVGILTTSDFLRLSAALLQRLGDDPRVAAAVAESVGHPPHVP